MKNKTILYIFRKKSYILKKSILPFFRKNVLKGSKFFGKVGVISCFLFHLIWKNYVLYWDFDTKSWIVDFFTRFTREKTPQNNFSSQNFSVENNYFLCEKNSHFTRIICKKNSKCVVQCQSVTSIWSCNVMFDIAGITENFYRVFKMDSWEIRTSINFFFRTKSKMLINKTYKTWKIITSVVWIITKLGCIVSAAFYLTHIYYNIPLLFYINDKTHFDFNQLTQKCWCTC